MLTTSVFSACLLALVSHVTAQPTQTTSAAPTIHTVEVGKGDFRFNPNTTLAKAGDIVAFNFYPTNHSVIRAAYGLPCIPIEDETTGIDGFASPNFLTQTLVNPPQWNLTINDTEPVFFYCSAPGSCTQQGMVGVINPNASVSLQDQYDEALRSPYMLTPGEPFPNEGTETQPSLTPISSLLTATPTGVATATATTTASAPPSSSSKLSGGAIGGIVIAGVAFVGLLAAVFWLLGHRRGRTSTTAGKSLGEKSSRDRTAAWAASSSAGTWAGSSDGGGFRALAEKAPDDAAGNVGSTTTTYQVSAPVTPSRQANVSVSNPSVSATYFPTNVPWQNRAELGDTAITELEAPHVLKD